MPPPVLPSNKVQPPPSQWNKERQKAGEGFIDGSDPSAMVDSHTNRLNQMIQNLNTKTSFPGQGKVNFDENGNMI